jgi:hypothetical protein
MKLLMHIEQVIGLVQLGIASAQAIASAVKAGRMAVKGPVGTQLTAEDVLAHVKAAQDEALRVGEAAKGRIIIKAPEGDTGDN